MGGDLDIPLNTCVSALLYLQQEVRIAHWNIKGPSFYSIHPLLGDMKNELEGLHDSIAERASGLGYLLNGKPLMASMPASSKLDLMAFPEAPLLGNLVDLYQGTQIVLKRAVEVEGADYVTIDIVTTVASTLAVHEYKLLSHWVRR